MQTLKEFYDIVSFEQCITKILPGGGALYSHADPVIKTYHDFKHYPWDKLPDLYVETFFEEYASLRQVMPQGMLAIGGPGNGLFEITQDLCGYEGLCFLSIDDPGMYEAVFEEVCQLMKTIWKRFFEEFSDLYCVCRFGDDLGYRNQTLLCSSDIKQLLIPRYKQLVDQIHAYQKPFLLHSCGCIFDVMNDLIDIAGIDAKHSNEDTIAPFSDWIQKYGKQIGNFGGIDTDILCSQAPEKIQQYVTAFYEKNAAKQGGLAFGSGNSIPDYMPMEGYLTMITTIRELRGEME